MNRVEVEVTCIDGEVLVGSTLGYDSKRQGKLFYLSSRFQKQQHKGLCSFLCVVEKVCYL